MSKSPRNGKQAASALGPKDEVEKVFKKFDVNSDGKISVTELHSVLNALGTQTSSSEAQTMMAEIDKDSDGFIDLEKFATFHCRNDGDNDVRDAFELYDKDKNGLISARELHAVMKALGEQTSLRECNKMRSSVDVDGDGCINFEEFKKMMR